MFYCKDIYLIFRVNIYWVTSWVKCWCFTKDMKRSLLTFFFSVIICHPNRISKYSVSASFRLVTSDFSQRHLIILHYLHWKPKVIALQCTCDQSQGIKSRSMRYIIIIFYSFYYFSFIFKRTQFFIHGYEILLFFVSVGLEHWLWYV